MSTKQNKTEKGVSSSIGAPQFVQGQPQYSTALCNFMEVEISLLMGAYWGDVFGNFPLYFPGSRKSIQG